MFLKRYIASFSVDTKLFCMQLIRPENRKHFINSNATKNNITIDNNEDNVHIDKDLVLCFNEFKMGVLAKGQIYI